MAASRQDDEFLQSERLAFSRCMQKLLGFNNNLKDQDRNRLVNSILDELNAFQYNVQQLVDDKEANLLLCKLPRLAPTQEQHLLAKTAQVIVNIAAHQEVSLTTDTLELLADYLLPAMSTAQAWVLPDLLRAFGALAYENGPNLTKYLSELLGDEETGSNSSGLLMELAKSGDPEIRRVALNCLGNLCLKSSSTGGDHIDGAYLEGIFRLALGVLQTPKPPKMDDSQQCRMLMSALKSLQAILMASKTVHLAQVGPLLAALKVYMLLGVGNLSPGNAQVPPTLYATPTIHYDPGHQQPGEAGPGPRPESGRAGRGGGKRTRKQQGPKKAAGKAGQEAEKTPDGVAAQEAASAASPGSGVGVVLRPGSGVAPGWGKASSSESEYSDTEGGQQGKLRSLMSKVRLTSLTCLYHITKMTERKTMFGYWPSFISDSSTVGQSPTLFTTILKDPSPKARASGASFLSALLEGSKQYLVSADDSELQWTAFTPFSASLASTIKEVHRCLLLALVAENSAITLTQLIKCLSNLVLNVPYHKLKEGLLTRVIKQVRTFLTHKDHNVRVACLTCLGSVASVQPPLAEVTSILVQVVSKPPPPPGPSYTAPPEDRAAAAGSAMTLLRLADPEVVPPEAPPTLDQDVPWLFKLCAQLACPEIFSGNRSVGGGGGGPVPVEPLPLRLEACQVMTHLVRGYFHGTLSSPQSLQLLCQLVYSGLAVPEQPLRLHMAKLFEEFGRALLLSTADGSEGHAMPGGEDQPSAASTTPQLELSQVVGLWSRLLSGPVVAALQDTAHSSLCACVCDCLSNIGPGVFLQLSRDKRVLCITVLLGLSNEEDYKIRAAAVRALGVYVLYPCLREDVMFVADTASAVLKSLEASALLVRIKAAWSLGNLSDAMVTNREKLESNFSEEFSEQLLGEVFAGAIKASEDNDKVKANSVRAVGNLLRFIRASTLEKSGFQEVVEKSVQILIKNAESGAMKTRWNACYAIGNMLHNPDIPIGTTAAWTDQVYATLANVITLCKNFKVRINAALALSVPETRRQYGSGQQFGKVWDCLLAALEGCDHAASITEYKYSHNLRQQILLTLTCLICHLTPADLSTMRSTVEGKLPFVKSHMAKHVEKLMADADGKQTSILKEAGAHIAHILPDLTKEEDQSFARQLQLAFLLGQTEVVIDQQ